VSPEGEVVTTCVFEYGETDAYGLSVPCQGATPPDAATHPVHADISDLSRGRVYHFRVVTTQPGEGGVGANRAFETAGAIARAERAKNVDAHSATLVAEINPHGSATSYFFEYGPTSAYGSKTETDDVGTGEGYISAERQLQSLMEASTYHWRLVLLDAYGEVQLPDHSFATLTTQSEEGGCPNQEFRVGLSAYIPDCRAYEQATATDKSGGSAEGLPNLVQAAPSGSAITFYSQAGVPGGRGAQDFPSFIASRSGGDWATQGLLPPQALGEEAAYLGVTPNFKTVIAEATLSGAGHGLFAEDRATGAIATVVPYNNEANCFGGCFAFAGASASGSAIFFESPLSVTHETPVGQRNLYVWHPASDQIALVGVNASDEPLSEGAFGGGYNLFEGNTAVGGALEKLYVGANHAISDTGDRAVFTEAGTGQLYMRSGLSGANPTTIHMSASRKTNGTGPGGSDPNGPRPAAFLEATSNEEVVYFMSREELTNDANTGEAGEGRDLYSYRPGTDELTDLSPDAADENGAEVQGLLGISADGSVAYFVAKGTLAPGAHPGQNNLYRLQIDASGGRSTTYISTLSEGGVAGLIETNDARNWSPGTYTPTGTFAAKTARVSQDGDVLLFMSHLPLTGYDNQAVGCNRTPGGLGEALEACPELFRYSVGEGAVHCISCDQTQVAPVGPATLASEEINASAIPSGAVAAILPRNLSADGDRIFFQTPDALSSRDTNGLSGCKFKTGGFTSGSCQDVYEWEAAGEGSCPQSASTSGCTYLLSSGQSEEASYLADADAEGNNAFLFTASRLVASDRDNLYDIYDASVGGGLLSQQGSGIPSCTSEAFCQEPAEPGPIVTAPGSSKVNGPGNSYQRRHCVRNQGKRHAAKCKKGRKQHRRHSRHKAKHKPHAGGRSHADKAHEYRGGAR
jgi:hypothetical protein